MASYNFSAPRLYVNRDIGASQSIILDKMQTNYLCSVLRLQTNDTVLIFNGRDGEWLARLVQNGRKTVELTPEEQTRPQPPSSNLIYMFAPLKHARLDYMVQKAVEMGIGTLLPVLTRRTQVSRVNLERMEANAAEAAEQCGILAVPSVLSPVRLEDAVEQLEADRLLVFCDENAPIADPIISLQQHKTKAAAILIGPEGGFDELERKLLLNRPNTLQLSLGPRILRADTAAVAALALVQSVLGDWGASSA